MKKNIETHSLELGCDVPFKECPRSKGSLHLWQAVQNAMFRYVPDRTLANKRNYQKAINNYAKFFSQEPIKIS